MKVFFLKAMIILAIPSGLLLFAAGFSTHNRDAMTAGGIVTSVAMIVIIIVGIVRARRVGSLTALRSTGVRVDARVIGVEKAEIEGFGYALQLVDVNDETKRYTSGLLSGDGQFVRHVLDQSKESPQFVVWVDPSNSARYFVDVPNDLERQLAVKSLEFSDE